MKQSFLQKLFGILQLDSILTRNFETNVLEQKITPMRNVRKLFQQRAEL